MPEEVNSTPVAPQSEITKPIELSKQKPRRFLFIPKPLLPTVMSLGIAMSACETYTPPWEETPQNIDITPISVPAPKSSESTLQLQPREEQQDPLQAEVENRFGVKLMTQKDRLREEGVPVDAQHVNKYVLASPDKWDKPRLQMLERFLNKLPPKLFKLGADGRYQLRIILDAFSNRLKERIDGYMDVELNYEQFDPSDEDLAFKIYTHENTHGLSRVNEYVWHDEIQSILGYEDFNVYRRPIFEKVIAKTGEIKRSDLPEIEKKKKIAEYTDIAYGFGSTSVQDPEELISILTGFYIKGKQEFTNGPLSDFIDPKAVDRLYEFLRENVFDGKEYPNSKNR